MPFDREFLLTFQAEQLEGLAWVQARLAELDADDESQPLPGCYCPECAEQQ